MSEVSEIIKKMKEEAVAERKALSDLIASSQARGGGKITLNNLDDNLIQLIMTAVSKQKQPAPRTDKGAPSAPKKQDDNFLILNELEIKAVDDLLNKNNVYLYGRAGTGKSVSGNKIALRLQKDGYVPAGKAAYVLNCSQWTSPIQILGGWSIDGYKEGMATLAWKNGGVLLLDELPKLDANTAGLLNEILSKATEGDESNPPTIDANDGSGAVIPKHPQFYVIGTGNTNMKETSVNFGGNNQQDYSLVDRFAGSMYYVDFDYVKELSLTSFPVFAISLGIRNFLLEDANAVESISLRTMMNFNRIYELEMLREYFPESPLLENKNSYDTVEIEDTDNEGKKTTRKINQGKTLRDSVFLFINTLTATKKNNLLAKKLDTIGSFSGMQIEEALALAKNDFERFESEYVRLHGKNPASGKEMLMSAAAQKQFDTLKEALPTVTK